MKPLKGKVYDRILFAGIILIFGFLLFKILIGAVITSILFILFLWLVPITIQCPKCKKEVVKNELVEGCISCLKK